MARAYGRSVETEERVTIARMRRAAPGVPLDSSGSLPRPKDRSRLARARTAGAIALEVLLLVLFGLGLSSAALHSKRDDGRCVAHSAGVVCQPDNSQAQR